MLWLLLLCNKLFLKHSGFKQPLDFDDNFVGQEFGQAQVDGSSLGVSHEVAVRCWVGLQTSKGWTELDVRAGSPMWWGA